VVSHYPDSGGTKKKRLELLRRSHQQPSQDWDQDGHSRAVAQAIARLLQDRRRRALGLSQEIDASLPTMRRHWAD